LRAATAKPVVLVSATGEALHPELTALLKDTGIPLLRGLRPALAAVACFGTWGRPALPCPPRKPPTPARQVLRDRLLGLQGPIPAPLATALLAEYGLPIVRSALART